jgi:hypothetical protein
MAVQNNHLLAKCFLAELFSKGMGVFQKLDMDRIPCQEEYKEPVTKLVMSYGMQTFWVRPHTHSPSQ